MVVFFSTDIIVCILVLVHVQNYFIIVVQYVHVVRSTCTVQVCICIPVVVQLVQHNSVAVLLHVLHIYLHVVHVHTVNCNQATVHYCNCNTQFTYFIIVIQLHM